MSIELLKKYSNHVNIAHELEDEKLHEIGLKVLEGYQEDLTSMQDWLNDVKIIEELTSLKSAKKSVPLANSSNVKLPIITKACYEFSSRTYPAIFKDSKLVKAATLGPDKDGEKARQGKRVSDFMNYQLLFQYQDWELEQDRLLFLLSMIGFICKKEYYDPIKSKIVSKLCDYKKLIVNADITSLRDAPRITEIIPLRLNDVMARKYKKVDKKSVFLEKACDDLYELHKVDNLNKEIEFIEQQVELDLDEDGIGEPYIVTCLKTSGQVFRIAPRFHEESIMEEDGDVICIYPINIYVDYHFLTNPNGKFQSVGFGILLLHMTQAINSVLNQLIDAGQLANMKGGYMDARLKVIPSTNSYHETGEFKFVKALPGASLKDGIVPLQYGEPSSVLFQLLGLLIAHSRDLSASTEINNGTQSSQNAKTGATLALMQQGRATFDAIQKRVYRSMSVEFRQLFDLNKLYLEDNQYAEYIDGAVRVSKNDFDAKRVHILPVADPNLASDQERLANAAFVQSIMGMPGIDPVKATRFILAQTNISNIEQILADPNAAVPPNPDMLKLQADMEEAGQKLNIEGHRLEIEEKKQLIEAHKAEAEIALKQAQAMLALAQAEALPMTTKLKDNQIQLDAINSKISAQLGLAKMQHEKDLYKSETAASPNLNTLDDQNKVTESAEMPTESMAEAMVEAPVEEMPSESGNTED